jgi:hypothetical protein
VAGQFVSRVFVVLLRKRFPQKHNLQTAAVLSVIESNKYAKSSSEINCVVFTFVSDICH